MTPARWRELIQLHRRFNKRERIYLRVLDDILNTTFNPNYELELKGKRLSNKIARLVRWENFKLEKRLAEKNYDHH